LLKEGADILDIGAESTRPGAEVVSAALQIARLRPIVRALKPFGLPLSIDTSNTEVALEMLKDGASIINDTSNLEDERLAKVVSHFKAGLILMHRRGNAKNMQSKARYRNVVREVIQELKQKVKLAERFGVLKSHLAIDPGIGFSKKTKHNLELLNNLEKLNELHLPVCVGTSRKSFLGKITGEAVNNREWATAATVALSVAKGARLIRVHAVRPHRDVILTTQAILGA
jgi:dihydropteroate synthase